MARHRSLSKSILRQKRIKTLVLLVSIIGLMVLGRFWLTSKPKESRAASVEVNETARTCIVSGSGSTELPAACEFKAVTVNSPAQVDMSRVKVQQSGSRSGCSTDLPDCGTKRVFESLTLNGGKIIAGAAGQGLKVDIEVRTNINLTNGSLVSASDIAGSQIVMWAKNGAIRVDGSSRIRATNATNVIIDLLAARFELPEDTDYSSSDGDSYDVRKELAGRLDGASAGLGEFAVEAGYFPVIHSSINPYVINTTGSARPTIKLRKYISSSTEATPYKTQKLIGRDLNGNGQVESGAESSESGLGSMDAYNLKENDRLRVTLRLENLDRRNFRVADEILAVAGNQGPKCWPRLEPEKITAGARLEGANYSIKDSASPSIPVRLVWDNQRSDTESRILTYECWVCREQPIVNGSQNDFTKDSCPAG